MYQKVGLLPEKASAQGVSLDCNTRFPNFSSTVSPGMFTKWV